jgi:hypothetical protein
MLDGPGNGIVAGISLTPTSTRDCLASTGAPALVRTVCADARTFIPARSVPAAIVARIAERVR